MKRISERLRDGEIVLAMTDYGLAQTVRAFLQDAGRELYAYRLDDLVNHPKFPSSFDPGSIINTGPFSPLLSPIILEWEEPREPHSSGVNMLQTAAIVQRIQRSHIESVPGDHVLTSLTDFNVVIFRIFLERLKEDALIDDESAERLAEIESKPYDSVLVLNHLIEQTDEPAAIFANMFTVVLLNADGKTITGTSFVKHQELFKGDIADVLDDLAWFAMASLTAMTLVRNQQVRLIPDASPSYGLSDACRSLTVVPNANFSM